MFPTLVIGLREGLEASLIVGIVAAFLKQKGRTDLLRWVFAGIAAAIALCLGAGVALAALSRDLPQRQQEGLETVIGVVAVGMVTYMIVWMRRHARDLKGHLQGAAGDAIARGSGWAMVAMAFLAVLREGMETAVFLLAAFNETGKSRAAGTGALLGILLAVGLGYLLYRGGIRLNLSRFFRTTAVVLVLVAAGLVLTALHTAHEAGWLNIGQQSTVDLSAIAGNGSVQSSLLTGVLGVQAHPVLIEVVGWFLYLVPLVVYVAWPPGKKITRTTIARVSMIGAATCAMVAALALARAPAGPAQHPLTRAGAMSAQVISTSRSQATIRATVDNGAGPDASRVVTAQHIGGSDRAETYRASQSAPVTGRPAELTYDALAAMNGGRLPLGARGQQASGTVPVTYTQTEVTTFSLGREAGRITDVTRSRSLIVLAHFPIGDVPLTSTTTTRLEAGAAAAASQAAAGDHHAASLRRLSLTVAGTAGAAAVLLALVGLARSVLPLGGARRPPVHASTSPAAS